MSFSGRSAGAPVSCEEAVDRLVSGIRVAEDLMLSQHVGSCLGCFRVAADMREVSRIKAGLMLAPTFDPGERYWDTLPQRVIASWDTHVAGNAAVQPLPRPSLWTWMGGWLRLPVPAAFAGGAVVGLLIFALTHAAYPPAAGHLAVGAATSGGALSTASSAAPRSLDIRHEPGVSVPVLRGDLALGTELDEALLGDLEDEELRRVLDGLGGSPAKDGLSAGFETFGSENEITELPSAVEALDDLDLRSLRLLKQALGRDL